MRSNLGLVRGAVNATQRFNVRRRFAVAAAPSALFLLPAFFLPASAPAQQPTSTTGATPSREIRVPKDGLIRSGEDRRASYQNELGKPAVGLVHVDVGDQRLLVMPNGQMTSLPIADTQATQQPFVSYTKELIAEELLAMPFLKGFKSKNTARYLYIYDCSEEFYYGTSRILESMYQPVFDNFKRQKFAVHNPPTPLVVIMFRDDTEFQQYHAMPDGVVAYYSSLTNHIVMYEHSRLSQVARGYAIQQAIATIAHESIHQILHNIGVQQRLSPWPQWTSEGLAEYFAPTSVDDKKLKWKGVGVVNDMRMFELELFLKQGSTRRGEMVEQTVTAPRLSSTGYASAWALTHFLAFRYKDKFFEYLREVSALQPLASRDGNSSGAQAIDNKAVFIKYFGDDFGKLEDDLIKHLKRLPYTRPNLGRTR